MKNKILGLSLVFVVICMIIAAAFTFNTNDNISRINFPVIGDHLTNDVSFILAQDVEFFNDKIKPDIQDASDVMYKLHTKLVNKEEKINKLKKIFKLENSIKTDMGEVISFNNEDCSLDINENGTFTYSNKKRNYSSPINLSDEECISIAKKFLKENKLLPNGFFENGVAHETKTSVNDPSDTTVVRKDVYFNRKVNGKTVYGVLRIIVSVGLNGQIDAVYSLYRDIEEAPIPIRIKPLKDALSDLKQFKGLVRIGESTKSVNIKSVDLVYWEDSTPFSEQTHIQPVYHFKGEAFDDAGNKDDSFEAFIAAIPDDLTRPDKKSQMKSKPSDIKQVKSQSKQNKSDLPQKSK